MLEASSPEERLHILEDCLTSHLVTRSSPRGWGSTPRCEVCVRAIRPGNGPMLDYRDCSPQWMERTKILTGFSRADWISTKGVVPAEALSTSSAAATRRCKCSMGSARHRLRVLRSGSFCKRVSSVLWIRPDHLHCDAALGKQHLQRLTNCRFSKITTVPSCFNMPVRESHDNGSREKSQIGNKAIASEF
jgi:hypothetical protein